MNPKQFIGKLTKLLNINKFSVRQPIFIVGCGRSGTTLLFDILSQHPDLARTTGYPDGEDHEGWIKHGKCCMAGIGNIHHTRYGNGINGQQFCLHMTKADVSVDIIRDMHSYYWQEVLKKQSCKRVLNKQPHLSNKLQYVLGIFPDAKIIHIIRDCEPMVASWIAVMEDHPSLVAYWPVEEKIPCFWLMPKPNDETALALLERHDRFYPGGGSALWVDYWCKMNLGIVDQMKEKCNQLLTIRYEDLIGDPTSVLSRINSFCEIATHKYKTDQLQNNTHQKHMDKITEHLRRTIDEKALVVRKKYGYML